MVPYTIDLLNEDGSVHETRAVFCEHDGAAMDHASKIRHWHAIEVWDGERCVGRAPADRIAMDSLAARTALNKPD